MGCCRSRKLLAQLQNGTSIYSRGDIDNIKNSTQIKIQLEGDMYKICSGRASAEDTDEICNIENDLLTLLKDQTGIRTGQHRIQSSFGELMDRSVKKNVQNMVFLQPKVSSDNKIKLFKCLVRSIYDFDKSKSLATSLENIYVPWSQLTFQEMNQYYQQQMGQLTVLISNI